MPWLHKQSGSGRHWSRSWAHMSGACCMPTAAELRCMPGWRWPPACGVPRCAGGVWRLGALTRAPRSCCPHQATPRMPHPAPAPAEGRRQTVQGAGHGLRNAKWTVARQWGPLTKALTTSFMCKDCQPGAASIESIKRAACQLLGTLAAKFTVHKNLGSAGSFSRSRCLLSVPAAPSP